MNIERILSSCDHTCLDRCATRTDIERTVNEGIKYSVASVCIPPCYVKYAKGIACGRVKICTVIGFPNGYSAAEAKVYEAKIALSDGADEIDTVINVGALKVGRDEEILAEINAIKAAIGDRILKVIVETCLLTEEEKIRACRIVSESRADYIKTSTGFSTGGATLEDVRLMAENMTGGKKIKAAGGISSLEDAEAFLDAGVSRLGTSRIVKLVEYKPALGY